MGASHCRDESKPVISTFFAMNIHKSQPPGCEQNSASVVNLKIVPDIYPVGAYNKLMAHAGYYKDPRTWWFQARFGMNYRISRWFFWKWDKRLNIGSTDTITEHYGAKVNLLYLEELWGYCSGCICYLRTPTFQEFFLFRIQSMLSSLFLNVLPATPKEIQTRLVCSLASPPHCLGFA